MILKMCVVNILYQLYLSVSEIFSYFLSVVYDYLIGAGAEENWRSCKIKMLDVDITGT